MFKARGTITRLREMDAEDRAGGVTAVSSGSHAIATVYAANVFGASAKVVMIETADPMRIAAARGGD
jgi:threonine dehydratase